MFTGRSTNCWQRYLVVGGSILLTIAFLWWARPVVVPVVLAILLTFILSPAVSVLQRWGTGRIASAMLVVGLACILLVGLVVLIAAQIQGLGADLPKYKLGIINKIAVAQESVKGSWLENVNQLLEDISKQMKGDTNADRQEPVPVTVQSGLFVPVVQNVVGPFVEVLATAVFVVVLAAFMLVQRENLRNRFMMLLGARNLPGVTRAIDDGTHRISRFLLVQVLVNLGFAMAASVGLMLLGVPYAILWGLLAGVLRYIPYLGAWLGATFPVLVSLAMMESWAAPFLVLAMIGTMELVLSNVLEPRFYGHSVGVSEVPLIIMIVFWTWLWGPVGLVLSTPLTACLAVLGRYVPALGFLQVLIGNETVMAPSTTFFQRILAHDENEAAELVDNYVETHTPQEAFTDVLVPALLAAEQSRARGETRPDDNRLQLQVTRELLDEYLPGPRQDVAPPATGALVRAKSRASVLGLPVRDEAEELALDILARIMGQECRLEVVSSTLSIVEASEHIEQSSPGVVIMLSLAPNGLPHIRYLCKKLRGQFEEVKIAVGLWGSDGDAGKATERLTAAGANCVGFSISETRTQILSLLQEQTQEDNAPIAVGT